MQLARPYQIALAVIAAAGLMWTFLLRPHNGATNTPVHVTHATLPGANGLATAVAKARGAVTLSQHNAAQLAAKSAAASNPHATGLDASAPKGAAKASRPANSAPAAAKPAAPAPARSVPTDRSGEVTSAIAHGKVVVLLFWDARGADDQAVKAQIAGVSRHHGDVVVLLATPDQVASFGSVTRGVQILETPTTLVIDPKGQATVLTGLTDAVTIDQAVSDAERGSGSVQTPSLSGWTPQSGRSAYVGRANNLCHSQIHGAQGSGSLQQQINSFHGQVNGADAQINAVRSLPQPPADRAALARWFGDLSRAGSEIGGAASAASAQNFASARSQLFAAQADWDRGSQGLADYGMSACFSSQSRTS